MNEALNEKLDEISAKEKELNQREQEIVQIEEGMLVWVMREAQKKIRRKRNKQKSELIKHFSGNVKSHNEITNYSLVLEEEDAANEEEGEAETIEEMEMRLLQKEEFLIEKERDIKNLQSVIMDKIQRKKLDLELLRQDIQEKQVNIQEIKIKLKDKVSLSD